MYNITGKIKTIYKEQQVSEKFRKREFVVTDNSSQYPQHILFQLTQDRVELIKGYGPGEDIKVHFNLRGREWTDPHGEVKYFNSLDVWKIEGEIDNKQEYNDQVSINNDDDLPF